jgi:hypothetical protein
MKKLPALTLLALLNQDLFSQDRITMKSGSTYEVKVLEITDWAVHFRMQNNPEGPLYNISKSAITSIQYQNGVTEHLIDPVAVNEAGVVTINGFNTSVFPPNAEFTDIKSVSTPPPREERVTAGEVLGFIFGLGVIALQIAEDRENKTCNQNNCNHSHGHCATR